MARMDDEKNRMTYEALREDCEWKEVCDWGGTEYDSCRAGNMPCIQKNCVPLLFAIYFNRPEVKNG